MVYSGGDAIMATRDADYGKENKMVVRNDYVKAIHPDRMSVNAMKLFRLTIAQCKMNDKELFVYRFKVEDLAKAFNIESRNLYREVQSMCISMMQMVLLYGEDDPRKSWTMKHIVEQCSHEQGSGEIVIQLHSEMTDLLLKLKKNFTKVPIASILLMRSKYSIRILEVLYEKMRNCLPFADTATEVTLTLEEIRKATGTEKKKTYDRISNLKDTILNPALNEIEETAGWKILRYDLKKGRKVTGFRLEVWSRNGWEYIEDCKAKGIIPNRGNREYESQIPGQMSIFDFMGGGEDRDN